MLWYLVGILGLLICWIFCFSSCVDSLKIKNKETTRKKINYTLPSDSIEFSYCTSSWKKSSFNYSENQYGQNVYRDKNNHLMYASINSLNELHTFDFQTNKHSYSKEITDENIDAYLIENERFNLIYENNLIVKDFKLRTLDSFIFNLPKIIQQNGIDFSMENKSNLFKVNNYFVLMYFVVDHRKVYRNSKLLFYYFNKDTAFFNNRMCKELENSFQYFRYPAVCSDGKFLIHSPRVLNCISKSNEIKTCLHKKIHLKDNYYLKIKPEDQYEMSRLKKYRFSTYYNKEILFLDGNYYLLQEFPSKITYFKEIPTYKHSLRLQKYNNNLEKIKSIIIKDNVYQTLFIEGNYFYVINFNLNKCYKYEI